MNLTNTISRSSFSGDPVKLHYDSSNIDNYIYLMPGGWILTKKLGPITDDLFLSMAVNMNDKNVVAVTSYFKKQFSESFEPHIAIGTIDKGLQQLLKAGLIKRLMNGIFEVSKDIYLHKSAIQ